MKLLILTFTLVLTTSISLSAQGVIPQPTHDLVRIAPDAFSAPTLTGENFYYFNGNGDLFETKSNRWDGTNWSLESRIYYTLNDSGQPTLVLRRFWFDDVSMLEDFSRTTTEYEPNGLVNFEKREQWDRAEQVWETVYIALTTYNNNGRIEEKINQEFTDGLQSWGGRDIYTYDASNRVREQIYQTWEQGGVWKNYSKTDYTYTGTDENNYEALLRYWDEPGSNWGPVSSRATQTVTPSQKLNVREDNINGIWVPSSRYTETYNNDGQIILYTNENWNTTTSVWKIWFKVEYTYNQDQSIKKVEVYQRDASSDIFFLWIVIDSDYGNYPVAVQTPLLPAQVSISPNPTSDFLQVTLDSKALTNLSLLDMRGNVLANSTTSSSSVQLSLATQPPGTYFLRVEQGGAVKVLPVVKN